MTAKPKRVPAPARVVTLRSIDGRQFRLVTPFGNRDFQMGILSTDEKDPACQWLVDWANGQKSIEVNDSGARTKVGVKTCPVCDQQVGSDTELAEHNEAVHVQPESKGQPKTKE